MGFPGGAVLKNPPADAGDTRDAGSVSGLGRSPGVGNGNPLQYSCLENPHGQRSLLGDRPWSHKESDTSERLSVHTTGYYKILNIISLCYTVGPYCLLYIQCVSANPKFLTYPPPFHFGNLKFVLYACKSISVLQISSFVSYFRFYIEVISHGIDLSLSDLLHLV